MSASKLNRLATRAWADRWRWGALILLGLALVLLLKPVLLAPVMTDARYLYVIAPERGGLLGTAKWAFVDDVSWRLEKGRIAPFGVFVQGVFYLVGMRIALATGLELYQVEAGIKVFLIAVVIGLFALLLSILRTRSGERLQPTTRWRLTVLFAVLLSLGVHSTSPVRNGWTAFVVLCVGGVGLLMLSGVLALRALERWPSAGRRGRIAIAIALALLGALTVLSYEAHWAAVPFVIILVLFAGTSRGPGGGWRTDRARWVVAGAYAAGFAVAMVVTRVLIATFALPDAYAGLTPRLDGPLFGTVGWQMASAVPGAGRDAVLNAAAEAGVPAGQPGDGWVIALIVVAAFVLCWVAPGRAAQRAPRDAVAGTPRGEASALAPVAVGALLSLLACALIVSVSVGAQELVTGPGSPYRGTPWIWSCIAMALVWVAASLAATRPGVVAVVVLVVAAIAAQVRWVRPLNATAADVARSDPQYALYEEASRAVVLGPDVVDEATRCDLVRRADVRLGGYGRIMRQRIYNAYTVQWHEPMCPARPTWRNP